ncbi:hypothetical protein SELMODRAFT_424317 [Selaginella moellendorffii]|uniref:FBD domain-containing protein n=1 Tax=Selaginella moellendorffii TaxID=88036 RepID=D8SPH8_SELML|nr:hypothetical protein SELMODRAFT_424317 [Selaginella moellendorffii]
MDEETAMDLIWMWGCSQHFMDALDVDRFLESGTMEAANTSSPRWLACADSVAALRLHVPSMFLRLGRAVLDLVSCMGALESLQISGGCYSSDLARMAPRRRLRRSSLSRVNARLLEELLAACPLLEELHVGSFICLSFQSESLEVLTMYAHCKLNRKFDKLRSLKIGGYWELDELVRLFELMPTITEITFEHLEWKHQKSVSLLLEPLVNLRIVHFVTGWLQALESS